MKAQPTVFVVDDDAGHTRLVAKNLRRVGFEGEIRAFSAGQQVLDQFSQAPHLPDGPLLILLDLNMPGLSGQRVLRSLKNDVQTRHVPVVVLTTADNPAEVRECYDLGCNLVMVKPVDYAKLADYLRRLVQLIQVAELPV